MAEVIMRYKGSGEDFNSLEKVGDLIRCKDCKWSHAKPVIDLVLCSRRGEWMDLNGYCHYGERRSS